MELIKYHTEVTSQELLSIPFRVWHPHIPQDYIKVTSFEILAYVISQKSHGVPIDIKCYRQCVDHDAYDVIYTIPRDIVS